VAWLPPRAEFPTPAGFETPAFRVRPITIHDVVRDYDAVMTSRERLWALFGEAWGWPAADLTLEQDMIDLAWHQKEADLRRSFNFAVVSPDETRLLGCVYVDPPTKQGYDAELFWWARDEPLEEEVGRAAREWLEREWPFERVATPGRDIPWPEYEALPDA
jgi:hypothetical protein